LLLRLGDFVLNPRAEILWLAIRRRLLDDRDLHEFTPIGLIDWGTSRPDTSGRPLRQAHERRLKCSAVTRRRIHVPNLCVRGDRTPATAHGHERTVATLLFVRTEMLEPLRRRLPPALDAAVDMANRCGRLAGESRTGVNRAVRSDRVGVPSMDFTRSH